ncbi:jg26663 [Pararge aegeria aegeria]|uniref:Jg26663 protein n=1 Tax=Pararge aegeria aegeria TaxID=348720 RepID=A0A8S4QU36_9NEOP|nr:jg26663 [Pararge aegeria aegeria]
MAVVQYTAAAQHTTTTSSAPSGRRRSTARPLPSRCDPEEFSEAPTRAMRKFIHRSINLCITPAIEIVFQWRMQYIIM